MNEKVEYSAYIDDAGYVHSLGSNGEEGSTQVAPLSSISKERGVSTVIHNHPHGTSDGRIWGGPLSSGDLEYIARVYSQTGGKVNKMIATAREGTYSAKVTKPVSDSQVKRAVGRAEKTLKSKKYPSERAMWREANNVYTSEFAKIGIEVTYSPSGKRSDKLVTEKTGTY